MAGYGRLEVMLASSVSTSFAESRDKSVKIRIISRKGNTREETRRELMAMSADEIDKSVRVLRVSRSLDHKLTRNVVFQELLKLAVEGSDCLIEEARVEVRQKPPGEAA